MVTWHLYHDKLKSVNTMHPSSILSSKQSVKLTSILVKWINKILTLWMVDIFQHTLAMIMLLLSSHVLSFWMWFTPHILIERESGKLKLNDEFEFFHFTSSCDILNGTRSKCTQFMYFCAWTNLYTFYVIWIVKLSLGKYHETEHSFLMSFLFISSKKMMSLQDMYCIMNERGDSYVDGCDNTALLSYGE